MDRGNWLVIVHGVVKSWRRQQLNNKSLIMRQDSRMTAEWPWPTSGGGLEPLLALRWYPLEIHVKSLQ